MKKSFYLDENLSREVGRSLCRMEHKVQSVATASLRGASDTVQLEYAVRHQLILVTRDMDFVSLHAERLKSRRPHCGIMRLAGHDSDAATRIVMVAAQHTDTTDTLFGLGPENYTRQTEGQPQRLSYPCTESLRIVRASQQLQQIMPRSPRGVRSLST